jgi:enamine deaminase RidA (YjgF/YER057c/UK114 family)
MSVNQKEDSMSGYDDALKKLGLSLPPIPPAAGNYVPAVQVGNLVFCSGQGPFKDGSFLHIGRVGAEVTLEQAYDCAAQAALNCLAEIVSVTGSLDAIRRIVQLRVFVNSAPEFFDQPKVANGASDLLGKIFGEAGKHARCALGTSVLPGNIPVEIEMVVQTVTASG